MAVRLPLPGPPFRDCRRRVDAPSGGFRQRGHHRPLPHRAACRATPGAAAHGHGTRLRRRPRRADRRGTWPPAGAPEAPSGSGPDTALGAGAPGRGPSRVSVARRGGAALSVVVAEPSLWLLGSAGFLVRGGLVLLALPIVTLPSPVGITTLLGPAVVNTGRLEGPLLAAVAAGLLLVAGLCLAGLFAAAWIDAALFERFVADPHTARLPARRRLPQGWRRPT